MIRAVYISYIIIKKFSQIDLKFVCNFISFFVFSCTAVECMSVKKKKKKKKLLKLKIRVPRYFFVPHYFRVIR